MNKSIFYTKKYLVLIFIGLTALGFSAYGATPTIQSDGKFSNYTGLIEIPEKRAREQLIPGYIETAAAVQELVEDVYGDQHFKEEIPELSSILENHPGYWPELRGRLRDFEFARLFGPDFLWLRRGDVVLGELNGANTGGHEFMQFLFLQFKKNPSWGAAPYDADIYLRWGEHIRDLVRKKNPNKSNPVIVWADEASLRSEPFSIVDREGKAKMINPPFSISPEVYNNYKMKITEANMHFVSLVDDREKLQIIDGVLYLIEGETKLKVDAFLSLADLESMDPDHEPQRVRNSKAGQDKLNDMALVVGKPGLVKAWLEPQGEGFIWINNPTSMLTRSKAWSKVVRTRIEKKLGRAPLVPDNDTEIFVNADGTLNEDLIARIKANPRNSVLKPTTGDGGKGILIGGDLSLSDEGLKAAVEQIETAIRLRPHSYIRQPFTPLQSVLIPSSTSGALEERLFDSRTIALISGGKTEFKATLFRHPFVRLTKPGAFKVNVSGGGGYSLSRYSQIDTVRANGFLPHIGIQQVTYPHVISEETRQLIFLDARERTLTIGYLLRAIYSPDSIEWKELVKSIPELELIKKNSFFFKPNHFLTRSKRYPTIFLSGPDYVVVKPGNKLAAIEDNLTNLGGLLREFVRGDSVVTDSLKDFFGKLKEIEQSKKQPNGPEHNMVYLLEETEFGIKWSVLRKKFKRLFGFEIATASEVSRNRFQVKNERLYYTDDNGISKIVTTLITHIEPDFIDPLEISDEELLHIMSADELHKRRQHAIPGLASVIRAGNLMVVNEQGHDFGCDKTLLPLAARLRQYFLRHPELIPTQATQSFIDGNGNTRESLFEAARKNPVDVIKYNRSVGGSDGVFPLAHFTPEDHEIIFDQMVRKNPSHYIIQALADLHVNELGFHTEIRPFHAVAVDLENHTNAPEVIFEFPVLYGRAANGFNTANILPGDRGNLNGLAPKTPGFNVPIQVDCATQLAELSSH